MKRFITLSLFIIGMIMFSGSAYSTSVDDRPETVIFDSDFDDVSDVIDAPNVVISSDISIKNSFICSITSIVSLEKATPKEVISCYGYLCHTRNTLYAMNDPPSHDLNWLRAYHYRC